MPFGDLLRRNARKFPNKPALVYGESSTTYGELNHRVNGLAHSLLQMGLRKGDRLATILHNGPEYIEILLALAKIGGILVPVNNLFKQMELKRTLHYVTPRFLLLDPDYYELIDSISTDLEFVDSLISLEGSSSSQIEDYESLIRRGDGAEPEVEVSDDDVLSVFLTSGTTGLPKGVMRTHKHEINVGIIGAIELKIDYEDRAFFVLPFYHVALVENLARHLLMANTIFIRKEGKFDPKEVLATISREQITMCQFVPTMINAMLQEENIEAYDLSHFRLLVYVGSTIPVAVLRRAMDKFKCGFAQFYGQTEGGPSVTALRPKDHILEGSQMQLAKLASAGRPVVNYEVRIVDKEDNDVEVGDVGEIIARGDAMTVGYWNLAEETAKTLRGGWLHTGDMGRFDEDGYVYIVDRRHDMIISGGKNIYPREIEEVLYQHEAILEAAVIGVPDDYWGESVKALVVLKKGMETTEEEIIYFCKENLASYKKPRSVEFRKELPKSATGKILKRVIREDFWKGMDRKV